MITADGGLEHKSLITEVIVGMGSGLVGLHWESTFTGMLFAVSRNRLAQGGANPDVKALEHKK